LDRQRAELARVIKGETKTVTDQSGVLAQQLELMSNVERGFKKIEENFVEAHENILSCFGDAEKEAAMKDALE